MSKKKEYINILISHLELNNLLVVDIPPVVDDSIVDIPPVVDDSVIDSPVRTCCSHCVENQSRILALEEHVKNLEETMQKMKSVINKLVQHANTKQESSGEPKPRTAIDMTP